MMFNRIVLLFAVGIVAASCGTQNPENSDEGKKEDSLAVSTDSGQALNVLSLPAPLQVSNALKELSSEYKPELLKPFDPSKDFTFSKSHQAVIFGMLGVDMGYAMFNNQKQISINYFSRISRLADEMNIEGAFNPKMIESFRNNINNLDSLIPLTLTGFNNAHNYLEENNRRSEGLLILAGCFIEGLHISIGHAKVDKSKDLLNVVGQQKLYLENFIELFSDFNDKPEIMELVADFKDLKTVYDGIEIKYSGEDNAQGKKIEEIPITDEQLDNLHKKVEAIRTKMLS